MTDGRTGITGTMKHFWQNFPSSLEAKGNQLKTGLFSGNFNELFELQGGEQKTHKIYLNFRTPKILHPQSLAWVHYPFDTLCLSRVVLPGLMYSLILFLRTKFRSNFHNREAYEIMQDAVGGESRF